VRTLSAAALLGLLGPASALAADPRSADPVERGEYVFQAGGCLECHTDIKGKGPELAGGRALESPFGTFYSPNITPHAETGIGRWTPEQFAAALRHGERPDGAAYYPAFPYTSYTGMTDADIADLWAYLKSRPAVEKANPEHDLPPPFAWRWTLRVWRGMFFEDARFAPDPTKPEAWNRGAYLANVLGHCAECHTPRNLMGARDDDMAYAGNAEGPGGEAVPNITPHPETGIGNWSEDDIVTLLEMGMTPDGDFVGGEMALVVENSTAKLTDEDRRAIAIYLKSLAPLENAVASD